MNTNAIETTKTIDIQTIDINGTTVEVRATVDNVTRAGGYTRGSIDIWNYASDLIEVGEVGSPESKRLVKYLAAMFDITLPSLRVKTLKQTRRAAAKKVYAIVDADSDTFQQIQFTIAPVGRFAEQTRLEEERAAKWQAREDAETARRAKALEIATKAMDEYAHLRITEMEVEVDGLVFEVTRTLRRGWGEGDTHIEVRYSPINADRNYGESELGYDIKPNKTVYPTDAERAAM